ncbi:Hemin uptake protein hemP [Polystyrenella longa]|uniref:Hemin uptake protein hemP n=1 Tax=Polystyrenella longa TaxID=2528007 RepID=A0A518CT38_9PLAN|nr:hemin uptake protein HemP [Polystyrenella longa]QDU82393.1 Hemin uptake protein hemP [Polystyrenella longa]
MPGSPDPEKSDRKAIQPPRQTVQQKDQNLVPQVPLIRSTDLLGDNKEIQIQHGSELYRLCLTKSGKLILHK